MASTGFIDIRGEKGSVYVFDNSTLSVRERLEFALEDDFEFQLGEVPGDITEFYVSLPLELLNFRVLDLGLTDLEKVRQVLPYELQGIMLGDPQDAAIDARIMGRKVLAVYVEKSKIRKLLAALASKGMDPRFVTSIDLGALLRSNESADEFVRNIGQNIGAPVLTGENERVEGARREIEGVSVNFRRGELAYRKDTEMTRRALKLAASLLTVLVLLLSADMAVRTLDAKREIARVEADIIKTYSDIFPGRKAGAAAGLAYKMRSELAALKERDRTLRGVSMLDFLMEIQRFRSPDFAISSITLDAEGVVMKGEAASLSAIQNLKGSLAELLSDVAISGTGQTAEGRQAFTITARGFVR